MKPYLADINVLFALLLSEHEHHQLVLTWYDHLSAGELVLCRMVHLGLIRLLGNAAILGKRALSAADAWALIEDLMEDERMEFASEPASLNIVLPKLFKYSVPTTKLVGDAYLAAFSIAAQLRFATLDQGFKQFKEVDLELLRPWASGPEEA
jgi:toxin-antitoxin system PIN domain toxin